MSWRGKMSKTREGSQSARVAAREVASSRLVGSATSRDDPAGDDGRSMHRFEGLDLGSALGPSLQPRLEISSPRDRHERQADRVADRVETALASGLENLHPTRGRQGPSGAMRGSRGKPLDPETRAFMDSHFGFGLGDVRIHDDTRASTSARAIHARAFTVGQDIFFNRRRICARNAWRSKVARP